jgi:hypothetical protein
MLVQIIGSIDNASRGRSTYHLIFTSKEILQFLVMDRRESYALMRNTIGFSSGYRNAKIAVQGMASTCLERGKEIEEHIETRITGEKGSYISIDYSEISDVSLSGGNAFTLPHLSFIYKGRQVRYNLIQANYKGRGKLPEDVISSYRNTLEKALPENLKVGKGAPMSKVGFSALSIGIIGSLIISAVFYYIAILQNRSRGSAFTAAVIIYVSFFIILGGISLMVLSYMTGRDPL